MADNYNQDGLLCLNFISDYNKVQTFLINLSFHCLVYIYIGLYYAAVRSIARKNIHYFFYLNFYILSLTNRVHSKAVHGS